MTDTSTQLSFDQAGFEGFLANNGEPDWLLEQRREAWERFSEMDWPSPRHEEWIRTDIRLFGLDRFALPSPVEADQEPHAITPLLAEGIELAGQHVTQNGQAVRSELADKWRDKGVLFGSLEELVCTHGDLIRPHLFRAVETDHDRFSALHAACWTGSTLLYVPKGVAVDQPLLTASNITDDGVDLGHVLVILEDGAEATVLRELTSSDPQGSGLHCGAVELLVGNRAHLRFVNLQDWGERVWHFAHQAAVVGRDASLQWTVAALGSRVAKVNQRVSLVDVGAECQVNGVLFTQNKQHISYHTLQHHQAPHCTSDFLYKAALQDRSRTVWRGMIKVDEKAQKTNGYQRNDNLLLSDRARSDSIPGLEIDADDVRCTHGSTSGRVDDELLFYAQCRGFTRREAIRAIVTGFFQQIFDRVTIESVRDALSLVIARRVRDYN